MSMVDSWTQTERFSKHRWRHFYTHLGQPLVAQLNTIIQILDTNRDVKNTQVGTLLLVHLPAAESTFDRKIMISRMP